MPCGVGIATTVGDGVRWIKESPQPHKQKLAQLRKGSSHSCLHHDGTAAQRHGESTTRPPSSRQPSSSTAPRSSSAETLVPPNACACVCPSEAPIFISSTTMAQQDDVDVFCCCWRWVESGVSSPLLFACFYLFNTLIFHAETHLLELSNQHAGGIV